MTAALLQTSLLDGDEPAVGSFGSSRTTTLTRGAWVEHVPGWLAGADTLFTALVSAVPWLAERRRMYDRVVDVPRLVAWYGPELSWPHPVLAEARALLSRRYGETLVSAGLCYYRDGRDSVAWHGDSIGRGGSEDTVVAIISVGAPRTLALREQAGSASHRLTLSPGDLLTMGGSCQRTWEHCVPKTARPVGPRISVQLRPAGVA
jgi:alkylated DNA repair dioxygenase AlkB